MKYFLDTEFIEDGQTIDLISIGIVAEDGRELYLLNYDCDHSKANEWVKENVLKHLPPKPLLRIYPSVEAFIESEEGKQGWRNKKTIADEILKFCLWRPTGFVSYDSFNNVNINNYDRLEPEFWANYGAYDWVVFCQLFGTMIDLPTGFSMFINDIQQLAADLGNPELPRQKNQIHNALSDAYYVKMLYEYLNAIIVLPKNYND